jgi:peptidoglycan/LPS O-acetylase OafA/YrhL
LIDLEEKWPMGAGGRKTVFQVMKLPSMALPAWAVWRRFADAGGPMPTSLPPAEFYLGHRPALDGVRGIAVLMVMAYHTPLHRMLPGANLFLDVFFVLSGFLITVLLAQERQCTGAIRLGHFYLRRGLRLLPGLLLVLGYCWVLARLRLWFWPFQLVYQAITLTLCYAANFDWYFQVNLLPLGHTWTLALEEQFYIVWPLALAGLLRLRIRRRIVVRLLLLGILASALLRAGLWFNLSPLLRDHVCATCLLTRADAFLAGGLAGLLAVWGQLPRRPKPRVLLQAAAWASAAGLLVLVVLLPGEEDRPGLYCGGLTLVAGGVALVMAALVNSPPRGVGRLLGARWLVWVGTISYGLYLWHLPIFFLPWPSLASQLSAAGLELWLLWVLKIGLTFTAATIAYYQVERPFLRLKDRLGRGSRRIPLPDPVASILPGRQPRASNRGGRAPRATAPRSNSAGR